MTASRPRIAVFLDRDGTLNHDSGYVRTLEDFSVFPESGPALAQLNQAGLLVIVVTNQSGIARGFFSYEDLSRIHEKLRLEMKVHGAWIDDIFVCPHHPDDGCRCRKPQTGMLEEASRRHNLDLKRSYMIGDKVLDMQVANRVGAKGLLVLSGPVSQEAVHSSMSGDGKAHFVADGIKGAVDWILQDMAEPVAKPSVGVEELNG